MAVLFVGSKKNDAEIEKTTKKTCFKSGIDGING